MGKFSACRILLLIVLSAVKMYAQDVTVSRVEPPFWWAGMNDEKVQLMVYGEGIGSCTASIDYQGVALAGVHTAENKNFLFLDLIVSGAAKPGSFDIDFQFSKKKKISYGYELKSREKQRHSWQGLDQSDVIYLLMPDRFVNGDPANDNVSALKEKSNRVFHGGRHGGDLQGIVSKTGYLEDLGVTALWINPLLENNMPEFSYHGYAITDYYKIDQRYGSNEDYRKLADELHKRDMKLVMDMVFNHCGREHWWMKDMPFANWINYYPGYVNTNHAMSSVSDPYAAQSDTDQFVRGWFVSQMPDLNHDNSFLATYLIQNSIWWIEYAGLDGIRMDTYPYNKKEFMAEWARRVYTEYPGFYLVGETWVESEAQEAWWAEKDPEKKSSYNSHLNSITDFPLCFAVQRAFKKGGDVLELYKVLSKDFLYYDPFANKIFVDNHDMDRFFHVIDKNTEEFKLALTFLFTTRGIPQLFYGTEILMEGHGEHGVLRQDFPGGWSADERNAFSAHGRTKSENEAFDYIRKMLRWRRQSDAIRNGTLKHFVPYDNIYVYSRTSDKESILVVLNNGEEPKKIDMTRYSEVLKDYASASDVINGSELNDLKTIELNANSALVLKLNPDVKAD